ncbi:MAG: hypothetical protein IH836_06345 [Proteobacteria bacterium]|nr:hypothetical protein [Pseudomonadota bacterium]
MTEIFEREMTITHRDFFRILPKVLKSYLYQQHENVISVTLDEGEIVIILAEERLREIASLSLPITNVTFQIKNVAKKSKKGFFKQFDRTYQCGVGNRILDKLNYITILSDICCKKDTVSTINNYLL